MPVTMAPPSTASGRSGEAVDGVLLPVDPLFFSFGGPGSTPSLRPGVAVQQPPVPPFVVSLPAVKGLPCSRSVGS